MYNTFMLKYVPKMLKDAVHIYISYDINQMLLFMLVSLAFSVGILQTTYNSDCTTTPYPVSIFFVLDKCAIMDFPFEFAYTSVTYDPEYNHVTFKQYLDKLCTYPVHEYNRTLGVCHYGTVYTLQEVPRWEDLYYEYKYHTFDVCTGENHVSTFITHMTGCTNIENKEKFYYSQKYVCLGSDVYLLTYADRDCVNQRSYSKISHDCISTSYEAVYSIITCDRLFS